MARNEVILHRCRRTAATGLLVGLALAAAGCGKKGPPRPPEPWSPRGPERLRVRQIGPEIRVWFTVPQKRGDRPSQELTHAELVRVDYSPGFSPPPDPDAFRRRGVRVGELAVGALPAPGERVGIDDVELGALEDGGIGSTLRYAVRLFDGRGRPGPLVGAADLVPAGLLPPPENLAGEATGDGVRLVWDPLPASFATPLPEPDEVAATPATETEDGGTDPATPVAEATGEATVELPRFKYNVYRGAPDSATPENPINPIPLTDTEYLDADAEESERYRYVVRVLLVDSFPLRESPSSLPIIVLAEDVIPPEPPTGLVAVQEGISVRLFWHPNSERDVAGNRVYRRVGQGDFEAIGPDLVEQTTFIDRDVKVGQQMAYRVSAVDRTSPPNESHPSELVEIDIVAEPAAPGDDP